jgi:hypothetical protein
MRVFLPLDGWFGTFRAYRIHENPVKAVATKWTVEHACLGAYVADGTVAVFRSFPDTSESRVRLVTTQ